MAEITYTLTDAEWADALKVGLDAALKARFEDGNPDGAATIGLEAGQARAREITAGRVHGA
ncbi:hypothetical protein [Demequina gelatinilytica]|uniref:hypothetical protein n=1 Tax=Demequina gelatinilytica TaxID=1638980 RepID=UPI00078033BA|nr:hypothetical protein [Demequina gelatinilytica]